MPTSRLNDQAVFSTRILGVFEDEILTSNPAQLVSVSQYLFAVQAGGTAIDVIRTDTTVDTTIGAKQRPIQIGQIEVDNDQQRLGTYDITMSTNGSGIRIASIHTKCWSPRPYRPKNG